MKCVQYFDFPDYSNTGERHSHIGHFHVMGPACCVQLRSRHDGERNGVVECLTFDNVGAREARSRRPGSRKATLGQKHTDRHGTGEHRR